MASSIVLVSASASAELIETDWQLFGNNLAVYDNLSGLTWLDLSVTVGMNYHSSGTVENARYATWSELDSLVHSYFGEYLDELGTYKQKSIPLVANWISLFRTTTSDNKQSNGFIARDDASISYFQVYNTGTYAHVWQANDNMAGEHRAYGTYMILEPSGSTESNTDDPLSSRLVLLTLGLAGFGARRK